MFFAEKQEWMNAIDRPKRFASFSLTLATKTKAPRG
jgi:hypothetical protein